MIKSLKILNLNVWIFLKIKETISAAYHGSYAWPRSRDNQVIRTRTHDFVEKKNIYRTVNFEEMLVSVVYWALYSDFYITKMKL